MPAKFLNVLRDRRQRARPAPEGPALRNRSPWRPSLGVATGLLAGFLAATAHAGDLLRGGAAYGQKNGAAAQLPGAAAASAAKANAQDILARTTQALQSIQNLQQAASVLGSGSNNAGLNPVGGGVLPNVPNGLTPGGLQVAPGATPGSALWQGANLPTQSTKGGLTTVSVNQTAAQATLTWQTFTPSSSSTRILPAIRPATGSSSISSTTPPASLPRSLDPSRPMVRSTSSIATASSSAPGPR